ncbi:MAG: PIN domain-containing protein [Actinobacteria bacterium]|nr:PIN domain-containing protein [Actinomycetota bacterium]
MQEPVFVDTWGWLSLGHRKDPRHQELRQIYNMLCAQSIPIYTSDYVLDELITLLFRREVFAEARAFTEGILASTTSGYLSIELITMERFEAAWNLRQRFADKPAISFTDLTSMVVMWELGIKKILTQDEHFLQVGMGFQSIP